MNTPNACISTAPSPTIHSNMLGEDETIFGDTVLAYSSSGRRPDLVSGGSYRKHVLVCMDRRPGGCYTHGSFPVKKAFITAFDDRRLDDMKVSSVGSMGFCDRGPVAVVYPDGVWYEGLTPHIVPRIIDEHILGDTPVTDHTFDPGFPPDHTHFIACAFLANCADEGGGDVYRHFLQRADDREDVTVTVSMGCLKECSMAPVGVAYPDGAWYTGITETQYDDIWDSHVTAHRPSKFSTGQTRDGGE